MLMLGVFRETPDGICQRYLRSIFRQVDYTMALFLRVAQCYRRDRGVMSGEGPDLVFEQDFSAERLVC